MKKSGFTIIEIVIVIAILAILMIMSFGSWRQQIDKARDADRKTDLQSLKTAFEDYFNDHECYPPATILSGTSDGLKPYLDKIPRDPITKQPYNLQQSDCRSYRILTHLDNDADPIINSLGCNPNCGYGPNFNYGVTSGNIAVANQSPAASASPQWYCQSEDNCTSYDPLTQNCSPVYNDTDCTGSGPTKCAIVSVCN